MANKLFRLGLTYLTEVVAEIASAYIYVVYANAVIAEDYRVPYDFILRPSEYGRYYGPLIYLFFGNAIGAILPIMIVVSLVGLFTRRASSYGLIAMAVGQIAMIFVFRSDLAQSGILPFFLLGLFPIAGALWLVRYIQWPQER